MKSGGVFDAPAIEDKIHDLEGLASAPDFWSEQTQAKKILSEIKILRDRLETWQGMHNDILTLEEMYELARQDDQQDMEADLRVSLEDIRTRFDRAVVIEMLSGEADRNDAYLTIHAGSGGTEACDWASMLYRMYVRWAERHDFKVETLDFLEAEGGIKSVTIQISGEFVYGYLKGETGVHRLVRISPFDANARRHTSFASVSVMPVLDESIEIDIRPEDIRIDTYRAGGAGGQKVNKTDSAVRITHLATGIVVTCQNERSQYKNKDVAMNILKSRLYEYYKAERDKETAKFAGEKKEIAWGSQIRSYVFQPYTMVKDHRNKFSVGNVQAVMDGDLDPFLEAYLHWQWKGGTSVEEEDEDI